MSAETPAKVASVRVYNRSARHFIHGEHRAPPNSFVTVPKDVADRWYRLFPDEVVEAATAQQEINGSAAEVVSLKEQLVKAEARVAELEKAGTGKKKASSVDMV